LDVELKPIGLSDAGEIERAVSAFAGSPNGGLIVVVSGASLIHRELIVTLAARYQLPVVYPYRVFVTGGGLTKVDAGHGSSASTDKPPPPRPPQRHRRHRARGWPRSQGQLALDYSHGRKLAFEPRGRFRGRHEPVGPIALAFKVSAVTARHGLELGQLRLQGFDADLGSAPYDFAARTMAAMNTRGAATKTTASAVHTSAHKNVTTIA
jgi:hypothetical protein